MVVHWMGIATIVAQLMEFAWGISLERRLQTILEAIGIYGSRERAIVGIWWAIESKENYKSAMELWGCLCVEEPDGDNKYYSKY